MLSRSIGMPSRKDGPPSIWDTHGISGNVFVNPDASSSAPYLQELNQWSASAEEPLHSSTVEKSERQEQDQDLRCQSGPSAQKFSHLQWRRLSKELWGRPSTTADFGSSFWQIPFTSHVCVLEDKIQDRGMYLFAIFTEAMQWIKEVEMVDSVDDLESSSSVRGISMPNFEVLDARIASALNKIIHNSHFRAISLEEQKAQKQDRFLRVRQIAYLIYEYFRVTGANLSRTMPTYSLLVFEMTIFRNLIQSGTEFCCLWRKSHLMTSWKDCTNKEYESLTNSRPYWNCTTWRLIHQKKLGPDYHRLKTMVKRSIEQDIRNKNFGARNGHYERNAVVKNQGTKQRVQRVLGDCWQWEANGQCVKGDNCSFRHDVK